MELSQKIRVVMIFCQKQMTQTIMETRANVKRAVAMITVALLEEPPVLIVEKAGASYSLSANAWARFILRV